MSDSLKLTQPVLDFGLLSHAEEPKSIKQSSKANPEKMEKVAEDFEALFIFNMLKELDKTTKLKEKGYMEETYMSIVYDKVSQFLAKNKGIGIKEMLMRYSGRENVKFQDE
jgi:Rod binding domain-containing protein